VGVGRSFALFFFRLLLALIAFPIAFSALPAMGYALFPAAVSIGILLNGLGSPGIISR